MSYSRYYLLYSFRSTIGFSRRPSCTKKTINELHVFSVHPQLQLLQYPECTKSTWSNRLTIVILSDYSLENLEAAIIQYDLRNLCKGEVLHTAIKMLTILYYDRSFSWFTPRWHSDYLAEYSKVKFLINTDICSLDLLREFDLLIRCLILIL